MVFAKDVPTLDSPFSFLNTSKLLDTKDYLTLGCPFLVECKAQLRRYHEKKMSYKSFSVLILVFFLSLKVFTVPLLFLILFLFSSSNPQFEFLRIHCLSVCTLFILYLNLHLVSPYWGPKVWTWNLYHNKRPRLSIPFIFRGVSVTRWKIKIKSFRFEIQYLILSYSVIYSIIQPLLRTSTSDLLRVSSIF